MAEDVVTKEAPEETKPSDQAENPELDAAFEKYGVEDDRPEPETEAKSDEPKEDDKAAGEEPQGESDEAVEPSFTQAQKDAAKFFGLDPEVLADLPEDVVERMMQRRAEHDAKLTQLRKEQGKSESPEESPGEREKGEAKEPAKTETFEPLTGDSLFENPDQTAQTINAMREELTSLRSELSKVLETEQHRTEQELEAETDKFFAGLDQRTFGKVFGSNAIGMIGPEDPLRANRDAVVQAAYSFTDADGSMSWPEALKKAVIGMYEDEYLTMLSARNRERNRTRNRGSMPPPSQARSAKGDGNLSDSLNKVFDEYGIE